MANGRIPVSEMVMRQGLYLWPSTAVKFDLMDAWLVSLGYPHMVITQPYGAYRSLADQIKVKAIYGKGAATPGYSNHGLGTAWDIYNIDKYPDAIIAQAAVKFGLLRDAGNGSGGIESWHMHDYNGLVPAGGDIHPVTPNDPTKKEDDEMRFAYVVGDYNDPKYGHPCYILDNQTGRRRWLPYEGFLTAFRPLGLTPLSIPQAQLDVILKEVGSIDFDGHTVGPDGK